MLHEPARPAHIQVHISLRVAQHLGDVQRRFRLLVKMHEQPISERRAANPLDKRRPLAGAGTVVQLEGLAAVGQLLGHAQDWGNADAAGKQHTALRPSASGNRLRGALIRSRAPACTCSCRLREPPREAGSLSTPIR